MEISWPGEFGEIHTRILERMKQVLAEDTDYPYLKENARRRLDVARAVAKRAGMTQQHLVHLGGYTYCLFPWLGTRSFRTLRKMIAAVSPILGISGIDFEGCYYMTFRMERGNERTFMSVLNDHFGENVSDALALVDTKELPSFEKYDKFIPGELLREAYATDRLDTSEASKRIRHMYSSDIK